MLTCEQVRFYALFNGYCDLKTPQVSISKVNHPSIYGLLCDDSGVDAQEKWESWRRRCALDLEAFQIKS
jgi:hypothetical protein